jgi:hydrogenase maturation protein HypF
MERWAIDVRGVVQGVGFRPFVYRLASERGLGGFVRNRTGSVEIEVEGERSSLEQFYAELADRPPPLARIDSLSWEPRPVAGDLAFRVENSEHDGERSVFVSADAATCPECLAELLDPGDRRHRYPFLNCTNCGPRLTIIKGAPYDRSRTTMAPFPMCAACREEYEDPSDRRFHAEPTACAHCGPALRLLDAAGSPIRVGEPLRAFADALRAGKIGALKGLGGYHLTCLATRREAVNALRLRKHRDEKPLAVMVVDVGAAAALAELNGEEAALLASPAAPIVLVRKRADPGVVVEAIAPGNPWLGLMLPYTPLHHLLVRELEGVPLVMTSGNRTDEPIAYQDDAAARLAGIADVFLVHDRAIRVRCDDSVVRVVDGAPLPVRRSRGYAPQPIALPVACRRPILAVGGQLKATFALGRGRQAFPSHHLGDLDHFDAYRAFERDIKLYEDLFAVTPERLVCDLHPDYATTRYATARARREGISLLAVQHHHAHVASCMAEHGLNEPVLGVAFDGTGYGTDGAIWGGEFLVADYRNFHRAAHLRPIGMPGGEAAVREPWRMAAAHLIDAGVSLAPFVARHSHAELRIVTRIIERAVNTPRTSSVGRLFDAVAALLGVRDRVSYEGQAAIELEWLAAQRPSCVPYPFLIEAPGRLNDAMVIDTRPLIRAVADDVTRGVDTVQIAGCFHATITDLIADVCDRLRRSTGIDAVVLSGGVFLNAVLTREASERLHANGFRVYRHGLVPPGDGGLSLGQVAIAAARAD